MFSDLVGMPLSRRLATASSRALALTLGATVLIAAPLARAEDETAEPTQYEVVGEPIDEPAPVATDPNAAGQPVAPPPTYTPTQPGAQQGYGQPQPAAAQATAAPPPTAFATGFSGGVFGTYSPIGRVLNFDSSISLTADLNPSAGFGGYIAGLGRWVGGGAQIRASWFLDQPTDDSWAIVDVSGLFRFRWHHKIYEVYGDVTAGFSIQSVGGAAIDDTRDGGMHFGISPGFRIFASDSISFFTELGGIWRLMVGDGIYAIGTRQFLIEFGIGFGA